MVKRQKIQIQHLSRLRRQMRRAYENGSATETLDGQDYSKNVDMAAVEGTEQNQIQKRIAIRVK